MFLTTFSDGSSAAPNVTPQYPTLVSTYVKPPPWKLAGVNYGVGIASSITLIPIATGTLPAGVSRSTATKVLTVTSSNVTVQGFDFSADGGWKVEVTAANCSVIHSNFAVSSAVNPPINATSAGPNLYVGYCVIEGGGSSFDTTPGALVTTNASGLTVQYCWLKKAAGDGIDAGVGGSINVSFNLIDDLSRFPGAHGDIVQLGAAAGSATVSILFNTWVQRAVGVGGVGTQGYMMETDSPQTVSGGEVAFNTAVFDSSAQVSFFTGTGTNLYTGTVYVHDNYVDLTGNTGNFARSTGAYPALGQYIKNWNMVTGAALPTTY